MDPEPIETSSDSTSARRGWLEATTQELRSRPLTYLAVAGLVALGPVAAQMIFPEAPIELVLFGGVTLGGFFGFCALADKLFE